MRSLRLILALLCSAAVVSVFGCAVKQPPAPVDSLKSVLPPKAAVPPAFKTTTAQGSVATDWLQTFGDAQLQALVEEGLQNNLDLRAAATRIDVAAALVVQARSLLYPELTVLGGIGAVGRDFTKDRSGIVGQVSWELDLWGRVRAETASAVANQEAAEADFLFARQSLAATIATLWYSTITTERLRLTALEATTVYNDLLGLVQQRNQIGQVGQQDVALANADLNRARQRERQFATSQQQAVRGLEVIVGRYPAAELALGPDLPAVPAPVPEGLPAELLERRPDLVAAERRLTAAFHLIQAAEAARLPRIALTASGGRSTSELLRLANVGADYWTVAANLLGPVFTGGKLQAQVRAANANQQTALALYGRTALRAFTEVESSLANEQLLADQQRYLESVLSQDSEALRLGRIRYDAGASDLLHVLQMQARQLSTQFDLINIRNDRLANRIALHLALGGGFAPPQTP